MLLLLSAHSVSQRSYGTGVYLWSAHQRGRKNWRRHLIEGITMSNSIFTATSMLTEQQAAEIVGVQAVTLRSWRQRNKEGQPPYHKPGGWTVRYRYSDLISWLDANRVEH